MLPTVGPIPKHALAQLVKLGFGKGAATVVLREMMVQLTKKHHLITAFTRPTRVNRPPPRRRHP
jgi:hypothetical protein